MGFCGILLKAFSQWVPKFTILYEFENHTLKITATYSRDQWVKYIIIQASPYTEYNIPKVWGLMGSKIILKNSSHISQEPLS